MKALMQTIKTSLKGALPEAMILRMRMLAAPNKYFNFSGGWASRIKFNEDGMATAHNADFIKSPKFMSAYRAGEETGSWGPIGRPPLRWRVFNACTLAKYALRIPGDFVECGTNKGAVAAAIINYTELDASTKKFFLLDTFQGFDLDVLTEKEKKLIASSPSRYSECYEEVMARFSGYSFVEVIRGSVPSTLDRVKSEKIAFLHLDMNCALPERRAIEYFWNRITPGGVVLLDDYGWDWHEEQKQTLDEFAAEKNVEVIAFPTGQGLLLKPYW